MKRLRAAQVAAAMLAELERTGADPLRAELKADPEKTMSRWLAAADTRLPKAAKPVRHLLAAVLDAGLPRLAEVLAGAFPADTRKTAAESLACALAYVIVTFADAGQPQTEDGPTPSPDMDCIDALAKEMFAEMDMMFAADDLSECMVQIAMDSLPGPFPGPLSVPNVAGCYNQILYYNNAAGRLADAQRLRRIICARPPGV